MKIIKRIILFFSLLLLYIIVKEFLELYVNARSLHPIVGYLTLIALAGFVFYFIGVPIFRIIKIPKHYGPSQNKDEIPQILQARIDNFKTNKYLIKTGFDFSTITYDEESYQKIINVLKEENGKIRKKYVSRLFYSSAVSRNGFIDAVLILSSSINLIKETFILYNGRVSNKDLLTIGKKVYYAMAIGGSEGVEIATEEIMHSMTIKGFNSIPFIDKIIGSITDGFVNAVLLTRVAFITENYCTLLYIESEKRLYPSPKFVVDTANHITSDITGRIRETLGKMRDSAVEKTVDYSTSAIKDTAARIGNAYDKTIDYGKLAINPAAFVLSKSIETVSDKTDYITSGAVSLIKDGVTLAASPFAYVLLKSTSLFKNDTKTSDSAEPLPSEAKHSIKETLDKAKASTAHLLSKSSDVIREKHIIDKGKHLASGTASLVESGFKQTQNSLKYLFSKSSTALKRLKKHKDQE